MDTNLPYHLNVTSILVGGGTDSLSSLGPLRNPCP